MTDILAAEKKLQKMYYLGNKKCKAVPLYFWEDMYNLIIEAFINKFPSLRPIFFGMIETATYALVEHQDNAFDKLKRMRRYLDFKQDSENSIRIRTIEDMNDEEVKSFCSGNESIVSLIMNNILPFFSMTEILQNIEAPENVAFASCKLENNIPICDERKEKMAQQREAVLIKLMKPTLVHLIRGSDRFNWKIDYIDRRNILKLLIAVIKKGWEINDDIEINIPKNNKNVFSILYKNPITEIDLYKNYNVVLIDHLYMIPSERNKKRFHIFTSPMHLTNGYTPIIGFNLSEPDVSKRYKLYTIS